MFDIGPGEVLGLLVVALIVLGPDKLPRYASDAAKMLRQLRRMATEAREEVTKELGPELSSLGDLNPRSLVRKHLLEPVDLDDLDDLDGSGSQRRRPSAPPASGATGTDGPSSAPRYDEDVT